MFSITKLFSKPDKVPILSKDAIAELLHTDKRALEEFETAYAKHILSQEPGDFFSTNSRQAAEQKHADSPILFEPVSDIERRIVDELIAQTSVYVFDGNLAKIEQPKALPDGTVPVENSDLKKIPLPVRPQLTGTLMKVDIDAPAYPSLLFFYDKTMTGKTPQERKFAYDHFRQGLDILDLDEITYQIIGMNKNSMGYWFPQLVDACKGQTFFKLPATSIVKVPMSILQLTRLDYEELAPVTIRIIDLWAHEAFKLDDKKDYFIKTGTYSSKFDFRNAKVTGEKEVRELGEYLLYIHHQALQMASPLCAPCIYGVSTTNEWVVRDFIHDKEGNPCIYKGLPLHTEYRVFVDCDTDQVIGISPYWEPETMKQRFGHEADADSPHQMHDYVVYRAHEETLMKRYHDNKDAVLKHIQPLLPALALNGQWSIDIMQNGDEFWIIDMALAENSAFYDCVPKELRNPTREEWLPKLHT